MAPFYPKRLADGLGLQGGQHSQERTQTKGGTMMSEAGMGEIGSSSSDQPVHGIHASIAHNEPQAGRNIPSYFRVIFPTESRACCCAGMENQSTFHFQVFVSQVRATKHVLQLLQETQRVSVSPVLARRPSWWFSSVLTLVV